MVVCAYLLQNYGFQLSVVETSESFWSAFCIFTFKGTAIHPKLERVVKRSYIALRRAGAL